MLESIFISFCSYIDILFWILSNKQRRVFTGFLIFIGMFGEEEGT